MVLVTNIEFLMGQVVYKEEKGTHYVQVAAASHHAVLWVYILYREVFSLKRCNFLCA